MATSTSSYSVPRHGSRFLCCPREREFHPFQSPSTSLPPHSARICKAGVNNPEGRIQWFPCPSRLLLRRGGRSEGARIIAAQYTFSCLAHQAHCTAIPTHLLWISVYASLFSSSESNCTACSWKKAVCISSKSLVFVAWITFRNTPKSSSRVGAIAESQQMFSADVRSSSN